MVTYIKKDIKNNYVELNEELGKGYITGSTWEDYLNNKWVKLSDSQLAFKEENPDATVKEVFDMSLDTKYQLNLAKNKKLEELNYYVNNYLRYYYIDGQNMYLDCIDCRMLFKEKCNRYNSIKFINNEDTSSDVVCTIIDDMNNYDDRLKIYIKNVQNNIDSKTSVDEVQSINVEEGHPDIINTTTEELEALTQKRLHNSPENQAMSFARAMINVSNLSVSKALEMQMLYPIWGKEDAEFGKEVEVGFRLRVIDGESDILYEVIQKHILSEVWKPGVDTASLYKVVELEHAGTLEDPIPYTPPMELFVNKYYTQNNKVYKCIRNSEIPLSHDLSELVDNYVELIK